MAVSRLKNDTRVSQPNVQMPGIGLDSCWVERKRLRVWSDELDRMHFDSQWQKSGGPDSGGCVAWSSATLPPGFPRGLFPNNPRAYFQVCPGSYGAILAYFETR